MINRLSHSRLDNRKIYNNSKVKNTKKYKNYKRKVTHKVHKTLSDSNFNDFTCNIN